MVGSISLYYFGGERLYTRYTALPPEYGKEQFYKVSVSAWPFHWFWVYGKSQFTTSNNFSPRYFTNFE